MCGLLMTRDSPSAPARTSSGRPKLSGRLPSSTPTLTPPLGGMSGLSAGRAPPGSRGLGDAAFPRLELPFHLLGLLRDLVERLANRRLPAAGGAVTVEELLASGVDGHVRAA